MIALGVTGGVGTGKSLFTKELATLLQAKVFDADATVKRLFVSDSSVQIAVSEIFGKSVLSQDGIPDSQKLREIVFQDADKRKRLENVLHPLVRKTWLTEIDAMRRLKSTAYFLAEIPLLFETGAESHLDGVIVVAANERTQIERLAKNRGLTAETARRIISLQLDMASKIKRANWVVWNTASPASLKKQAGLFALYLKLHHG